MGNLTRLVVPRNCPITAIEPNDKMPKFGDSLTSDFKNANWKGGIAEVIGEENHKSDLVIFGSSLNVTERVSALKRAPKQGAGLPACGITKTWTILCKEIEAVLDKYIPGYRYGSPREDPYYS